MPAPQRLTSRCAAGVEGVGGAVGERSSAALLLVEGDSSLPSERGIDQFRRAARYLWHQDGKNSQKT